MTYMEAYLKWTENTPSPTIYHKFVALFLVGSAAHTNVSYTQGHTTIYPNLYTVLISGPGSFKGVAMNVGKKLFKTCPERRALCAPHRTTLPSLTYKLSKYQEDMRALKLKVSGTKVAFCDELIDFLAIRDTGRLVFMNDMFDGLEAWDSETKTAGDDYIENPCLCMLGCTTREMLEECLGRHGFTSGFAGRVIFVSDENSKFVPFMERHPLDKDAESVIQSTLAWTQKQRGEMDMTQEAKKQYHEWQKEIDNERRTEIMDTSLQVLYTRLPLHASKLSMINALSRKSMTIEIEDVLSACSLLDKVTQGFENLYRSTGQNPDAGHRMSLLRVLSTMGPQSLNDLYKCYWHEIPMDALYRVINGLINDNSIEQYFIPGTIKGKPAQLAYYRLAQDKGENTNET